MRLVIALREDLSVGKLPPVVTDLAGRSGVIRSVALGGGWGRNDLRVAAATGWWFLSAAALRVAV